MPFLNQGKMKPKFVARPGIENSGPGTLESDTLPTVLRGHEIKRCNRDNYGTFFSYFSIKRVVTLH